MATYRLDIAYEGTRFKGWARQEGLPTVQGELEAALERLYGAPVRLTVAGRTDAGVHASGQVASFVEPAGDEGDASSIGGRSNPGREGRGGTGDREEPETSPRRDPETLLRALNALTVPDVAVGAVTEVPAGFDARRDASARRYRYRLLTDRTPDPFERRFSLHFPHRLDRGALDACAAALPGAHDFTAFTPTDTEHVRFERDVAESGWSPEPGRPEILRFEIEADAFMRNMVRALVGTMLEVAAGRRTVEDFARLLDGAPRPEAGETAPAHGLFLIAVRY